MKNSISKKPLILNPLENSLIMKISYKFILIMVVAIGILGMTGCEDHQDRYKIPPWLGGSSIETLEENGNYTIFLKLMEKANYKEPVTKQLFTLFVPDDNAFNTYFKSIGKNSVDDLTKDEAVQLFTLHVLRNPRSRFLLIYEYAWSEFQGPDQGHNGEYMSLFHRKPTPSTSVPYKETIRYVPGRVGEEVLMYTGDKNVPLFTDEWFDDYGGAKDGSDYLEMYPGSSWKKGYDTGLKGTNWHNAMVLPQVNADGEEELEVRTSSGFIYYIDRVVEPMPSIEEYMIAHQDKFGLYYDILQRFATYGNTMTDEQNRVLYQKGYDLVFNLAEERGPSTNTAVPPQNMWTAFLPNNETLQNYLDNSVLKYYPSIDSVPRVTLYYILQTQLSANLVLISKMETSYFNSFGDPTDIHKSDLVSGFMCSNGCIYETKKILEPNVFTCVPGLLFIDKDYSTLLYVLNQADMLSTLANPDADVTLFASTNQQLEEYGIRYNETNAVVEFRSPADDKWSTMNTIDLVNFAQDQIYKGSLSDFNDEGFIQTASGNYLYYNNNQVQGPENQSSGEIANVQEIMPNDRNGYLVKVDKPMESRYVIGQYLNTDPDVSDFKNWLVSARLLDTRYRDPITKEFIPNLKFFAAAKLWTAFIPTNDAMDKAIAEGIIPAKYPSTTEGKDSVNNWLMYHFIKESVVFDDGEKSGSFDSNSSYTDVDGKTTLYKQLVINNDPKNLSIHDVTGQDVTLDHAKADILIRKGVVHKLDSVLKLYE